MAYILESVRATQGLFMTDSWVRVFRAERKESWRKSVRERSYRLKLGRLLLNFIPHM